MRPDEFQQHFGTSTLNVSAIADSLFSRRGFIRTAAFPAVIPIVDWLSQTAIGAPSYEPLNRYPRMVHEFIVDQVRLAEKRNLATKAQLTTKADAEAYVEAVRNKIRECFGSEPERTPLNPRITGVVERDDYKIEKLIFDSRPGFPVTANLYLPKDRKFPVPGVVGTCGHSSNGKASGAYQSFSQGLARMGYACLIFDPIGQGERLQYTHPDLSAKFGPGVPEHAKAGNQQVLVGEVFGMWRAWDGIRALDYLLTREEVDKNHLGVTGNSGGGTMTTWLAGVEHRWTMAAPSCFVTTFRRNIENELSSDSEQCPPRAISLGLDMDDFLAAMAPKPVVILAKEKDFFDVRGSEEAIQRLKRLYALLGAEDNVSLFTGPTTHGYSQENREAMYRWFNDVTKQSEAETEPEITIEKDETLWCTPQGQVAASQPQTVFAFTLAKSKELARARPKLDRPTLMRAVTESLKLPTVPEIAPEYRILRYQPARDYPRSHVQAYSIETEPRVFAIVYMLMNERWSSRPPLAGRKATLYISHQSSDVELREEPVLREIAGSDPDLPLFTCDVRGIGESQSRTGRLRASGGSDYLCASFSLMLDKPYVGQKTFDVLRVLDWLTKYGYTDIHLVAKGWGALPATFAAVLDKRITRVTLKNALTSYSDVAESEDYNWPLSAFVPNVLAQFDLPDCYRVLRSKQLRQIEPWDALAGEKPS